ncbi:MAG: hypothetical protein WCJ76_04445, partial [Comamonadaceae bacterium]
PTNLTTDSIPVGKLIGIGVMSQPVLVQLSTLNNTLFNQNPDVTFSTVVLGTATGVTGGHFDVDYFFVPPTGGTQATATITVGTTGQQSPFPATLGAITVNGVIIVPALTVNDITNGGASGSTNANVIANNVTGGFTATVSNNVITINAPVGTAYNGQAISIGAGTSQTLTGSAPAAGRLVITDVNSNTRVSVQCGGTDTLTQFRSLNDSSRSNRLNDLFTNMNTTQNGYTTSCVKTISSGSTTLLTCSIVAPVGVSACSGGFSVDSDIISTANTGPSGGVVATGWTNFAPALTASAFNNNGTEATSNGDTCNGSTVTYPTNTPRNTGANYPSGSGPNCVYDVHYHQYDKVFDVTGVNMLNPSNAILNLSNGMPSLTQNFKLLVQNQYLSPAVKLHIGDPSYLYNVDHGYILLKNYETSSTLDPATLQTYRRDPNVVWPPASATTAAQRLAAPKPIGSLAFNMPVDALSAKNWWGNGDIRAGLIPTTPQCVWVADGTHDGNMYQPVIPPTNGVDGPGTNGWSNSSPTTTPATATGVRHGGALTFQLIRDTTPTSAIEMNVAGRPEYGWRVISSQYANYVLMEYATYWHQPNAKCFNSSGWTKTPPADTGTTTPVAKAAGSTDPKIGNLAGSSGGAGGTITSVTTTIVGAVTTTTINYSDGTHATITSTVNADGSVTIVTVDALNVTTTQTVANSAGSLKTGGDERARQSARTGRISWRELVAP